ncbi:HTH-like domain protein [Burkholderia pseudomallei MSHR520]|nr:HTH-like domain protein [Burkholderia pseudomallei MSHR520]
MQRFGASQRQTCALLQLSRTVYRYESVARNQSALEMRIKEITEVRVHYGAPRVYVMLRREGWRDNHKRVERVYRELGLSLRHKRARRNKSARRRQPKQSVSAINEIWSLDFVADALFDGRRLRTLTIVDNYTRECLAIEVDGSLRGEHVLAALGSGLRIIVRFPALSRQIMAASSFRRRSTNGRTRMAWRLTSHVLASRPTTQRMNPSTDASGRNASTRIGSCRWRTPDAKSRSGASTITRRALTLRYSG